MARVKNNDRWNFLVKICATTGMLFVLPLVGAIVVFLSLLFQTYHNDDRQIAVVVLKDIGDSQYQVEFVLNGVRHQQPLQSQQRLQKGQEIRAWITKDDPASIQQNKPAHEIRDVYIRILLFCSVLLVVNIMLYIYMPSLVCFLLILNIVLFLVSAYRASNNHNKT